MEKSSSKSDRRQFLKNFGTVFGMTMSLPIVSSFLVSCEQDESAPGGPPAGDIIIKLSDYPELQNPGGMISQIFNDFHSFFPLLIIRKSDTEFLITTSECPHQSCVVNLPDDNNSNLHCDCHKSEYSPEDGSVEKQPTSGTTSALPSFDYSFKKQEGILEVNLNKQKAFSVV